MNFGPNASRFRLDNTNYMSLFAFVSISGKKFVTFQIGNVQRGGKSPSYSCSKMFSHVFSEVTVTFLPFIFFVCNMKNGQFIQNLA